jgi:hypothetical protein
MQVSLSKETIEEVSKQIAKDLTEWAEKEHVDLAEVFNRLCEQAGEYNKAHPKKIKHEAELN